MFPEKSQLKHKWRRFIAPLYIYIVKKLAYAHQSRSTALSGIWGILHNCGLGCWGGRHAIPWAGQASRVPWLYGTVPYGWAEHTNSVAL